VHFPEEKEKKEGLISPIWGWTGEGGGEVRGGAAGQKGSKGVGGGGEGGEEGEGGRGEGNEGINGMGMGVRSREEGR